MWETAVIVGAAAVFAGGVTALVLYVTSGKGPEDRS